MARVFQKLSRSSLRRLGPGETLTEHGITFERLANGDGTFSVNVMVDGQRIHRIIGRESEGVNRTQCEEFIEKVRTDAREGRLSLPTGRKTHLTFAEAAEKAPGAGAADRQARMDISFASPQRKFDRAPRPPRSGPASTQGASPRT